MAEADKQQEALEVLKGLNTAVKTTKLYPPRFPQVANAFENGYELINSYLRKYGPLSFSLVDDDPKLCGLPVSQKTLGKIHGEDVYQQLKLLGLEHLVLEREISRPTFKQLITFFTTSPQLVNREGGGRSFVVSLGLNKLFPEEYTIELPEEHEDFFAVSLSRLREEQRVDNSGIQSISSEIDGETVAGQKRLSNLAALKKQDDALTEVVYASIANTLQGIHRVGEISFPRSFETILRNVNRFTGEHEREELARSVAALSVRFLDDFGLHILLLQNFPAGFGAALYRNLLSAISSNFDNVVKLIREEEAVVAGNAGEESQQYRRILSAMERLFETDKGKQFLVREKARKLLESGEKERQAKRIQAGIRAILRGDVNSLKNKEVITHLPATVESLIAKGKDKAAATILTNMTTELVKGDEKSHELLSGCLSRIGDSLINASKWRWLEKLSIPMMAWIKEADRADEVYENITEILLKLCRYYWENDKEEKADKILRLFFAIRTGKLPKTGEVVDMIGRLQDLFVDRAALPELLERSIEEDDDLVDRHLLMQGPLVARFLINTLLVSENTRERLKILELLKRMGPLLAPLLVEKLADPMPWHGKRNLLNLLAKTGTSAEASQIFDYLNHEDIRVQQEAFNCICELSGEDLKSNLLEALSMATGPMKEQVVRALAPMADEEVIANIAELLGDWKHFPDDVRDPLLLQIVNLLGQGASQIAESALEDFLKREGKGRARNIDESVWLKTKQSLRRIKVHRRELSKKQYLKTLEEVDPEAAAQESEHTFPKPRRSEYPEEDHVESLLADGDSDRARKMLVELIDRSASLKRFQEAERLREWLIEIAPSALNDIIRTAEAIEEAKSEGVSDDFLKVWSNLHDNLTTEEFNALYYSMEHQSHPEETILVSQGDMHPALFFINQGKVKLFYDDKGTEILIKTIEAGNIFGAETFFDASVWTLSAATLTTTEISVLPLKNTRDWGNEHPALESKLQDFSRNFGSLKEELSAVKKNRRAHKRHSVEGTVLATLIDRDGKEEGVQMKGEFADISRGGLSFHVRISSKKNARILLGRKMSLQVACSVAKGKQLNIMGQLINVRSLYSMNNDYAAHIKFDRLLTGEEQNGILEAAKADTD